MLKFGNKEFRNIQEQVEKNAKDIEKLIEEGVPGTGSELPTDKPTDNGQILLGNVNGSVEWSTETIREFQHELVSGENIKTINGVSILGSGNIQIEGGGSENNVVEFADNALVGNTTINPYVVDEATMAKLQDPNTIIKYNNCIYYYDKLISGTNIILYKSRTNISNNTAYGQATMYYNVINVRTVAGDYPAGLWYTIDTVVDVPCTLGTTYTEDGDYIWVASKSGDSADSAWQKYTPGSVDLSNYYTKTEVDNQFVDNATFNTTTMGINTILNDIPNTYATKTSITEISNTVNDIPNTYATKTTVDNLETQLRQEISGIDTRVTTLENATPGTGGNFNPQDPVTDNGQILIGNVDGTYSWSTQTIQEIWDTADGANTTANNNTTNIAVLDTKVNALEGKVTTLEQTTATKEYVDSLILSSLQGSY